MLICWRSKYTFKMTSCLRLILPTQHFSYSNQYCFLCHCFNYFWITTDDYLECKRYAATYVNDTCKAAFLTTSLLRGGDGAGQLTTKSAVRDAHLNLGCYFSTHPLLNLAMTVRFVKCFHSLAENQNRSFYLIF